MSEFTDLLKEAFLRDEEFDLGPGRDAILSAVEGYERRMRLGRGMVWFSVTFFTALMVFAVVMLRGDPSGPSTRGDVFLVGLALFGMGGVGFSKFWFQHMLNPSKLLKEIKLTRLLVLERRE